MSNTRWKRLPFRRNTPLLRTQGYEGLRKCVLCTAWLPNHHGFCDGSVGTVINEAMLDEAMSHSSGRNGGLDLVGREPTSCVGCGYIVCSCPPKETSRAFPQPVRDASRLEPLAPSGAEVSGQLEWTQEGVPDNWYCAHSENDIYNCTARATWRHVKYDWGRCDKHAPKQDRCAMRWADLDCVFSAGHVGDHMYPGPKGDFLAPKTEITRPGWETRTNNDFTHQLCHASGSMVWKDWSCSSAYWCKTEAAQGNPVPSLEEAFTAAEKAIEESGWRPDGWGESVENTFLRQKGRGFRVDFFENRWIYTCGIGDAWHNAPSMVQAFALAEASDGT